MFTRTRIAIGALSVCTVVAGFTLSACGADHQSGPDPTAANTHPGTNEAVIQFPDGFRNVAFQCFGTEGVYVTSRGQTTDAITSGVAVQADDPHCK